MSFSEKRWDGNFIPHVTHNTQWPWAVNIINPPPSRVIVQETVTRQATRKDTGDTVLHYYTSKDIYIYSVKAFRIASSAGGVFPNKRGGQVVMVYK